MFFLLQDEVVQFNHICVLFDYTYDCNWTAQKNTHLLSNWFAVPSMQTMRFRLFGPWVHGFGASERGEWSSMGIPLAVLYLAYRAIIKPFIKRHMRARYSPLCSLPESLWFSAIKEKTRGEGKEEEWVAWTWCRLSLGGGGGVRICQTNRTDATYSTNLKYLPDYCVTENIYGSVELSKLLQLKMRAGVSTVLLWTSTMAMEM